MNPVVERLNYIINFRRMTLALAFLILGGCAHLPKVNKPLAERPKTLAQKAKPLMAEERQRLIKVAHNFVGRSPKVGQENFRNDCSGAIRAIFKAAKLRLGGIIKYESDNDVKIIYRYVQKYGQITKGDPEAGDLVFFHNTYDKSRNGRLNDPLTHVGLVEKVEGTTIHFIHHLGQSIIRSRMNLKNKNLAFDPDSGTRINHVLRRAQGRHRAFMAAELFAGFGKL
jgi:probable lipoprotein NlpC